MYPEWTLQHAQMLQEICDFSDLGGDLDRPYKFYSNGMQARLALSLISAKPADLLILDDVFDGADKFFRKKISGRVNKMIESSGAVIFVSHSPDQILQVCNRAWLIQKGKIVFDGPPDHAIDLYATMSDPRQKAQVDSK
jgi:ABC-type polysaccharide/polyol phosphate transport system ATPase subunit